MNVDHVKSNGTTSISINSTNFGYRQRVVIRSCEVDPAKTATMESILDLLQETALIHVWMSGLLGTGFGAIYGMTRNDLMRVVSRMHLQGKVSEIDNWVGASGKTEIRRDRHFLTRTKVSCTLMQQGQRRDLNMNDHVNNVKYVRWMLETIEDEIMEENQLTNNILEYRKECDSSDILRSKFKLDEFGIFDGVEQTSNDSLIIEFLLPSEILQENGLLGSLKAKAFRFIHLFETRELKNKEIVRARTCQITVTDGFTSSISTIIINIITIRGGFIVIIIIVVLAVNI